MRYILIILFLVSPAMAQDIPEGKDPKSPVPAETELAGPRNDIDEVFADQIKAARTTTAKSKLANEILDLAISTEDHFEKYALIEQAQELAIDAKDLTLTFQAIDLLAETFLVDKEQLRKDATTDIAGGNTKEVEAIKLLEKLDALVKKDPTKVAIAANDCYKLAKTLRGPLRQIAVKRTIEYYEMAIPKLSTLKRMKAEERIKELGGKTRLAQKTPVAQNNKNTGIESFAGKWEIQYCPNRTRRTYEITTSGAVHFVGTRWKGTLVQKNGDFLLDFNDGRIERFNLSNNRLFIEHFWPKSTFPNTPDQVGIGSKVEAKSLFGMWAISFKPSGNKRTYVISATGDVYFLEENRKSKLTHKDGNVLLNFGDGHIESITPEGNQLRVVHYASLHDFPKKPAQHGTGKKGMRIMARIDGSDEIHINKLGAMWKHLSWNEPSNVQYNGTPWNTTKHPTFKHNPIVQKIASSVDFAKAHIEINQGRGKVTVVPAADHVKLIFDDQQLGSGEYDVVISFE